MYQPEQSSTLPEILWEAATATNVLWYVYMLAGIGFYGGYKFWGFFGRALYWLAFPFHAVVFTVALLIWGYIRLTVGDVRYISVPATFIGVFLVVCILAYPVGIFLGVPIGIWFAYKVAKREM